MKDFLEFLSSHETPSAQLAQKVSRDIRLGLRKKSILLRFAGFYFLGALISLSFCPQFGLGLVGGHGIAHYFRAIGDWACAAFCGSLFLSTGIGSVLINMKLEETAWVWSRYKFSLIFLPALCWMMLMLMNVTLRLPSENFSFHIFWIVFALIAQTSMMLLISKIQKGRDYETAKHS